ncbi:hypothetical protein BKP45_03945 [Anaerobacillus alkalidiazotrophicus]|uniref:DoxX family protein n=1 Tax=Anaerobacillus alkalidiazotrophicus TaxID=472963 RepID=A0A1S2MDT9_9BACI|nr:DoxX family membrane protein [Anaerobacillus alkalidiazotrophicus]OIJ21855.1 hypothetical protein BKP45_03945 [Anaerobacillus alkalidiazotrophicus]
MRVLKNIGVFSLLIVFMRVLFGIGWLLAGATKITGGHWFKEPGIFLRNYLIDALQHPNTPPFYKIFIENIALETVMILNYTIPVVQIMLGLFLIVGLFTIPSTLICLFMHINFILSGNMNLISLILYTTAFSLIIFRLDAYHLSLDKYFHIDILKTFKERKKKKMVTMIPNNEKLSTNS